MISTATPPKIGNTAPAGKHYFAQTLGISDVLLQRCLGAALSRGGDFAELYFESSSSTGIAVDEGIVKSASQSHSMGCGIRVLSGERTGYSYTDELTEEKLLHAARTAALIADGPSTVTVQPFVTASAHDALPRRPDRRQHCRTTGAGAAGRPRSARRRPAHYAGAGRL